MKGFGYLVFALFFNLSRILPVQSRKILLFNGHNHGLNGNLYEMKMELQKHQSDLKFYYVEKAMLFSGGILKKLRGALYFFVCLPFHMATAKMVFFNDNFLPLAHCIPSKQAQFVQLWHGAGAFKKFGLSTETDEKVKQYVQKANCRMTHLFVTSKKVISFYQEAFAIPAERIYATGVPITDIYSKTEEIKAGRERVYSAYPELKGKKLLLFTPTFRRTEEENSALWNRLPLKKMTEVLGDEWRILLRVHPKFPPEQVPVVDGCLNVSVYPDVTDLYFAADMLMTDYSSTVVEYCLLDRPIIMYAYDLEAYDRGFYRNYETTVPGPVAKEESQLLKLLTEKEDSSEHRKAFRQMQHDFTDTHSAERIWNVLQES